MTKVFGGRTREVPPIRVKPAKDVTVPSAFFALRGPEISTTYPHMGATYPKADYSVVLLEIFSSC